MKGWGDLGIVETIFEEETDELQSLSSPPLSPPLTSPFSPLQSCIDAWTANKGRKPDIKILVEGTCFDLHKEPLVSKSSYLKRQLIGVSEFTLSPPLKITADTFKQIADYCYSGHAVITPFNFVSIRTAVELLKMGDEDDDDVSLRERTESYFSTIVAVNVDFACSVFRSCLTLFPEAEQTAFLASRCLEALFSLDDGDGDGSSDGIVSCADVLKTVSPEDFGVIADSMQRRFTRSHDLLYRVVDLYFLVYNGKISEDQKTQICSSIDCGILSTSLLMHAVQNPRMPLRFIVQAMLIEQLNTHRTIFSHLSNGAATRHPSVQPPAEIPATLGAILERDAALRQVAQLRVAIETTSSKIQTLERELSGMKKLLEESEKEPGRSASCRYSCTDNSSFHKVEKGERGSISSSMLRFREKKVGSYSCLEDDHRPKVVKKSLGQRLLRGLKAAFGVSRPKDQKTAGRGKTVDFMDGENGVGQNSMLEFFDGGHPHHRSQSVS